MALLFVLRKVTVSSCDSLWRNWQEAYFMFIDIHKWIPMITRVWWEWKNRPGSQHRCTGKIQFFSGEEVGGNDQGEVEGKVEGDSEYSKSAAGAGLQRPARGFGLQQMKAMLPIFWLFFLFSTQKNKTVNKSKFSTFCYLSLCVVNNIHLSI